MRGRGLRVEGPAAHRAGIGPSARSLIDQDQGLQADSSRDCDEPRIDARAGKGLAMQLRRVIVAQFADIPVAIPRSDRQPR